jgi:hypothetical protein
METELEDNWKKDQESTGYWHPSDLNSDNLYINCYHPWHVVSAGFWGSALGCIIRLARKMPRFV